MEIMMDRLVRIHMLGVSDLLAKKENPRHRPRTVDSPLRRDRILYAVLFTEATHPTWKREAVKQYVADCFGVNRSYVFRIVAEAAPERREHIEGAARAFAECGYTVELSKPRLSVIRNTE
jgi:hypothetical protein